MRTTFFPSALCISSVCAFQAIPARRPRCIPECWHFPAFHGAERAVWSSEDCLNACLVNQILPLCFLWIEGIFFVIYVGYFHPIKTFRINTAHPCPLHVLRFSINNRSCCI